MKTSDDRNDEESDDMFSRATSMNVNEMKKIDSPTSGKYTAFLRPQNIRDSRRGTIDS